ncbi:MAG: hypothetical protein JWN15_4068 [Firmicutes bacterium]|nr:hypothetical protein [Bacillota bacterium]
MRDRLTKAATVTATLAALLLGGCDPPGFSREVRYNDVALTIVSPKAAYNPGEPVPIAIVAHNTGDKPFTFDTATGGSPQEPVTLAGLAQPRPAYDLIFVGYTVDQAGKQAEHVWLWSAQAQAQASATFVLKPGETVKLLSAVWQPPAAAYSQGQFTFRFADMEFPTGIQIAVPQR